MEKALGEYEGINKPNWGHAGEAAYIRGQLEEAVENLPDPVKRKLKAGAKKYPIYKSDPKSSIQNSAKRSREIMQAIKASVENAESNPQEHEANFFSGMTGGLIIPGRGYASGAEDAIDGGEGSGNFGHGGRPGKRGGSAKSGPGGRVSGNAGKNSKGEVFSGRDYSLAGRGMQKSGAKRTWSTQGKTSAQFPKGSGTTRISEGDVNVGLHTVNKYLNEDGSLTPERAELHEKIIDDLFAGKQPVAEGEQKTFYFLGGGSASGKGSFTNPERAAGYDMPDRNQTAVIDADILKGKLPEYDYDEKTGKGPGTTDREKAASFAHEESSALAKRAMEAAFANGYNCTLDGTGDGGVKSVMKKIQQARDAGYVVEARYCTASIENALERNIFRAKKSGRKVQTDSVVGIHKAVSRIFPQVASEFDHVTLWDHDGPSPRLVAECFRGQQIQVKDQALYQKFLDKANWNG